MTPASVLKKESLPNNIFVLSNFIFANNEEGHNLSGQPSGLRNHFIVIICPAVGMSTIITRHQYLK